MSDLTPMLGGAPHARLGVPSSKQSGPMGSIIGLHATLHDVAASAFAPDLMESGLLEQGHESHETITRRVLVHGVSLYDLGAVQARMLQGCREHAPRHARTAMLPGNEEADDRPDAIIRGPLAHEPPECRTRSDRTPGHRLTTEVAEKSNGCSLPDTCRHGRLALGATRASGILRHCAPRHAPAVLWPAFGLKEPFEVGPSLRCNRVDLECRSDGFHGD